MYIMPTIAEPIFVGILVSIINKFIINNHHLFDCCKKGDSITVIETEDADSSTSTSTTDAIEAHAHFFNF